MSAGQAFFVAGTVPLVLAGGLHVLYALRDTARPRYFAPVEPAARVALEQTTIRLRRGSSRGDPTRPSAWSVWLGVQIGFGVGLLAFGALCLLVAADDFALVERNVAIRLLPLAFSAAFLAISLRFFWHVQVVITGAAGACFVLAALLA